jgi:putative alpha-1,2-mannosidase
MYSNNPDGMAGNEDCGQMSAWYVLSAIGFYAVDPVSTHYVFGSPLFDRVTLSLAHGRKLVLEAKRQSSSSVYIESVQLNGKPHPNAWFTHAESLKVASWFFSLRTRPKAILARENRSGLIRIFLWRSKI